MLGGFREGAASPFNPASMVGNQPLEACSYATYVCTSHERKIAVQLQDRQMDCFVPVYRKRPPMGRPPKRAGPFLVPWLRLRSHVLAQPTPRFRFASGCTVRQL